MNEFETQRVLNVFASRRKSEVKQNQLASVGSRALQNRIAKSDRQGRAESILCIAVNFGLDTDSAVGEEVSVRTAMEGEYVEYYRQVHQIVCGIHDLEASNFILRMAVVNDTMGFQRLARTIRRIHSYYSPKYFILHIYGHGVSQGIRIGRETNCFLEEKDLAAWISGNAIPHPNMIMFNACDSDVIANALSGNPTLSDVVIIGCKGAVTPVVLRKFASRFYYYLALYSASESMLNLYSIAEMVNRAKIGFGKVSGSVVSCSPKTLDLSQLNARFQVMPKSVENNMAERKALPVNVRQTSAGNAITGKPFDNAV